MPKLTSLAVFLGVGGTNANKPRTVDYDFASRGWEGFVRGRAVPWLEWSVANGVPVDIVLDEPFGYRRGEKDFQFTQAFEALVDGCPYLIDGFPDAWAPFCRALKPAGGRAFAYIGRPGASDRYLGGLRPRIDSWLLLIRLATQMFVDAGMGVALDATAHTAADSPEWFVAADLIARNVPVLVEPWPIFGDFNHWRSAAGVVTDLTNYDQTAGAGKGPKLWNGRKLCHVRGPWPSVAGQMREAIRRGLTPMVELGSPLPPLDQVNFALV